jgi:hypothetical protein
MIKRTLIEFLSFVPALQRGLRLLKNSIEVDEIEPVIRCRRRKENKSIVQASCYSNQSCQG